MIIITNNNLATWCKELNHWKRPWFWVRLKVGEEGDNRGWDGWIASWTQWTWIWVSSSSWWWTGEPGVLQSMGLQRVRHNWATELNWTDNNKSNENQVKETVSNMESELSSSLQQMEARIPSPLLLLRDFFPHSPWIHLTHDTDEGNGSKQDWNVNESWTQSPSPLGCSPCSPHLCIWWHSWCTVPNTLLTHPLKCLSDSLIPLISWGLPCRKVYFGGIGWTSWDQGLLISFPAVHHSVPRLPQQ